MLSKPEREQLFNDNIKIASYCYAKTYIPKSIRNYSEDLQQCAYLALWKATGLYNSDKGKFSAYAFKYVSLYLLRCVDKFTKTNRHRKEQIAVSFSAYDELTQDSMDYTKDLSADVLDNIDIKFILDNVKLTKLQRDVATLLSEGYSQMDIARKLGKHRQSIARVIVVLRDKLSYLLIK